VNLNATLFAQLVVFLVLAWVTMKFVWPPLMKAIDERAQKIADGLAAADKAKTDLALAEKRATEELRTARELRLNSAATPRSRPASWWTKPVPNLPASLPPHA